MLMMIGHSSGTLFEPLIHSGLRLGLTLIITLMVISSPIFMLVNPASAAPSSSTDASPSAPSTIGQDGSDFTTQAALSLTRASQTNNFVASKAYYDISFRTATAGVIKSVVMDFPAGTFVGSANFIEAAGIGPGTIAASAGEVLTYTVTNAVNVPANTIIRIEIGNINNPTTPSSSLTVSITTRNAANAIIDGPTATFAYNLVQVGNAQIATGAVTSDKIATGAITFTKPADSFMKSVGVLDVSSGHSIGWNPDGVATQFVILEPEVNSNFPEDNFFTIEVESSSAGFPNHFCDVVAHGGSPPNFVITCSSAPPNGSVLYYMVGNRFGHIID